MRGSLIVLEGAEGVGKTTQARRLVDALSRAGVVSSHLREPGGTSLGEAIRNVLLEPYRSIAPAGEALLFMASRAQLVEEKVRPTLSAGHTIVLDRFFLSTYAYQIHGRGLPPDDVRAANRMAVGDLVPTVTLVLQLASADGLERAGRRSGHDYMETLGPDFHSRVGAAFNEFVTPAWQALHPECGPIVAVDATGSVDEVFERVSHVVAESAPMLRRTLTQVAGATT
ncbi:MAG: dTMP kinase [Gemmatimonadota bacterium]|nr:dTMP kinase [Gemmatimonadota bacterium]